MLHNTAANQSLTHVYESILCYFDFANKTEIFGVWDQFFEQLDLVYDQLMK